MHRPALALLAASAVLAGCLGPNDAPTIVPVVCDRNVSACSGGSFGATVEGAVVDAENATVAPAPIWEVGDHWTFRGSDGRSWTAVVASVGSTYEVRPTDNQTALMEAVFDFSLLGGIGQDLSGDGGAGRVKFFDWPLEENKTWGLTIDGMSLKAEAHKVGDEWRITARDGEGVQLSYSYSPRVKWFTSIRWDYLDFGLSLSGNGNGYQGDVFVASIEPRYEYRTGAPPAGSFNVGTGASAVAVLYHYEGQQGFAAAARLVDPKGTAHQPFTDPLACTAPCAGGDLAVYPAVPGTWGAKVDSGGAGVLTLTVHEVRDVKRAVR